MDEGFTQKELDDARKGVLQNNRIDRAKDNRLASTLSSFIDLERTQQWNKQYEQAIEDLTLLQVNMAFKKHINPDNISIIKAGDETKMNAE